MAEPFATVPDLEARWRPLTEAEKARAAVLLQDASAMLRAECPDLDQRITDGTLDPEIPKMIVCAMVRRAMYVSEDIGEGVSALQQTSGPFTRSVSWSNPNGNLYLSKAERKLLGCSSTKAFMIDTMPPDAGREYAGLPLDDFS